MEEEICIKSQKKEERETMVDSPELCKNVKVSFLKKADLKINLHLTIKR